MTNEKTITRAQLAAAFVQWEKERRDAPEEHGFERFEHQAPEVVAQVQADYVFELVEKMEQEQ